MRTEAHICILSDDLSCLAAGRVVFFCVALNRLLPERGLSAKKGDLSRENRYCGECCGDYEGGG